MAGGAVQAPNHGADAESGLMPRTLFANFAKGFEGLVDERAG